MQYFVRNSFITWGTPNFHNARNGCFIPKYQELRPTAEDVYFCWSSPNGLLWRAGVNCKNKLDFISELCNTEEEAIRQVEQAIKKNIRKEIAEANSLLQRAAESNRRYLASL